MTRSLIVLGLILGLSGCNGTNPFLENGADSGAAAAAATTTTDTGDPISSDRTILPGTVNPSSSDQIFRREARSDDTTGNGFAEGFSYNGATDTFFVDNIAFDGDSGYTRVAAVGGGNLGIGPFSVFENQATVRDGQTSADISQLTYRALYAVGPSGDSSIAIIRSGAYLDYGFGGFIYQREGGVVLPESGQAFYTGTSNYGGLRDFEGQSGIEYVVGDISVSIDFDDFNTGAGVRGSVTNRRVYDINQTDVTTDILSALGSGVTQLPVLNFEIQPGVLDSNGEMTGVIESVAPGSGDVFEEGNYYALLSGDRAQTITGIIVVTADDPRSANVTVRETAGFFATRQ